MSLRCARLGRCLTAGGWRRQMGSSLPFPSLRGSFFCLLGTAEASSQQEREGAEPALKYP